MLEAKDIPKKLELSRDSEDPFYIYLTDERDEFESLTTFDQARVEIKADLGGAAIVQRISGTNLTINTADSRLECDALTSLELQSLTPGLYLCDVLMHETGAGWHRTDRFFAEVADGVTDAP